MLSKIMWDNDTSDCPGCYGKIWLCDDQGNIKGESILIQTDWDCPGVAQSFGWSLSDLQATDDYGNDVGCDHSGTDGTVDCGECGLAAGDFISAAINYLSEEADGKIVDNPGY